MDLRQFRTSLVLKGNKRRVSADSKYKIMDTNPQWRIRRDAKIHAKLFGYPDESGKSSITGISEYMAVSKSRLNLSVEAKNTGSVYSDSFVNN